MEVFLHINRVNINTITPHILTFSKNKVEIKELFKFNSPDFSYTIELSTVVTMFYIRSSDFIYLTDESLYPFNNLFFFSPLPAAGNQLSFLF